WPRPAAPPTDSYPGCPSCARPAAECRRTCVCRWRRSSTRSAAPGRPRMRAPGQGRLKVFSWLHPLASEGRIRGHAADLAACVLCVKRLCAYNAALEARKYMRVIQKALTFDDVLLLPAHSRILRRDVSLKTRITRKLELNMPLVSAAMDTVTEARLAIAIAQEGGISIVHKNMRPKEQAAERATAQRSESRVRK